MMRRVFVGSLTAALVALLLPAAAVAQVAPSGTAALQAHSSVSVVTITSGDIGDHDEIAADAPPKLCPNVAGQGTFNVDATLERRPWQDTSAGHAYWGEFEAMGEWRQRAVSSNLVVRQRRPGAWLWGRIGGHNAPLDRPYVTHTTFYVRPGYDLWVTGAMAWRPGFASPVITLLSIKCRDPG